MSQPMYEDIHPTCEMEMDAYPLHDHIEMYIASRMEMECYFVQV